VRCGEAEDGPTGNVLTGQVDGSETKGLDELVQVFGRGGAVVVAGLVVGIAETSKVDRDDTVGIRKKWDQLVEGPPRLRETVHEQDRRAFRSRGDVMQERAVHRCGVVFDLGDGRGGVLSVHYCALLK